MANTNAETLSELERQAEARRAKLVQTVDELHNRVSPGAIRKDVRTYARGQLQAVEEQLRQNPLQAAAIAVVIAYPLWRIIGRIPAPVLLIGAGLALSRRSRAEDPQRPHSEEMDDGTGRFGAPGHGSGMKEKLSEAASGAVERTAETIEDVRNTASEKVADLTGALSDGYQSTREMAAGTVSQLEDIYYRTRDGVIDMIDRHPILVGGVAFVLGGFLASSLRITPPENRLLGETSDDIKRRTGDLASEGLGQAKAAASQIYGAAASQVREQGLTPQVAATTVQHAVQTAREAVERTLEAAGGAEPSADSSQPPRSP